MPEPAGDPRGPAAGTAYERANSVEGRGASLGERAAALERTRAINDALDGGWYERIVDQPTTFAPPFGHRERMLAGGAFTLFEYAAAGGKGRRGPGILFLGTSPIGLAVTAGVLAVQGARAVQSRREAAQEGWRQIDQGWVTVSDHGFHLQTATGLHTWDWNSILEAQLVAPGELLVTGRGRTREVRWILRTDWAELVFTLWARVRHPRHPQFVDRRWLAELRA